jgi:hypothetical protein
VGRPAGAEEMAATGADGNVKSVRKLSWLLLWKGHPPGGRLTVDVGGTSVALVAVSGGAVLWPAWGVEAGGMAMVVVIGGPDSGVAVTTM